MIHPEKMTWKVKNFIYGSPYNAHIATDKYYGVLGKIRAAYAVHKAVRRWPERDVPGLKALKNRHMNKRAFVICNGPSLNRIDLGKLKDEVTIGVNGIYLNFDKMGFKPTYYIVEDNLVAEDRRDDINNLSGMTKLFALRLAYCLKRDENTLFLNHSPEHDPWFVDGKLLDMDMPFSPDLSVASFGGNTVTYTSLQLAFYLGIREVYIIGADHNFDVPGRYENRDKRENYVIESEEDDVNHFDPTYFGKGYRWHNPKIEQIEQAYRNARKFYEGNGGKIYNATPGGYLEVFDRVDYNSLFVEGYKNRDFAEYKAKTYVEFKKELDRRANIRPLDYKNKWIDFNGKNVINGSFSKFNGSFIIDFLLNSHETNVEHSYDDKNPPMPLLIPPLSVYQVADNAYRIFAAGILDNCLKIQPRGWYHIRIQYDNKDRQILLFMNNVPIKTVPHVQFKLNGVYQVGKGHKNRAWKGKFANLSIRSYSGPSAFEKIVNTGPSQLDDLSEE